MTPPITEADRAAYWQHGFHLLRQIVPSALLADLRATGDRAAALARQLDGPQAQRLAALDRLAEDDRAKVQAFAELPELVGAVHDLLGPRHRISNPEAMAFLFEPAEHCWGLEWHRDWRDHMSAAKFAALCEGRWEAMVADPNLFNQINCALYEDTATWFVPGSHRRATDTPEEIAAARAADLATLSNRRRERSEAEQEYLLATYCRRMPGAVPLVLQAGDLVIYRSIAWHTGSYLPYRRRATLHCSAVTPEYLAFWERSRALPAA